MTKDIREKAEALIEVWHESSGDWNRVNNAVDDLRFSLRPSREEIADWLERFKDDSVFTTDYENYFNYAIEYLRESS